MLRSPITAKTLVNQTATTGATGSSGSVLLSSSDFDALIFLLSVSAMSATATLDVWVQGSLNGGSTWYDMLRFPRFSASSSNPSLGIASALGGNSMVGTVGASTISSTAGGVGMPLVSNLIQVYWALGGTTPSGSFSLTSYEHQYDRGGI